MREAGEGLDFPGEPLIREESVETEASPDGRQDAAGKLVQTEEEEEEEEESPSPEQQVQEAEVCHHVWSEPWVLCSGDRSDVSRSHFQVEEEFRLDPVLEEHETFMEKMNTWNFQIFDLVDKTGGKTGRILSYVSIATPPSEPPSSLLF